jgi:two-component system, sensor histidine kinase and response regulator
MKTMNLGGEEKNLGATSNRISLSNPIPIPSVPVQILWDKVEALERLGGDEELLRELCQIFLNESPKLLNELRRAIGEADSLGVMRAAHGLKGELGYLGAAKATQAARELEDMGHDKNLSRAAEVFAVLDQAFTALHLALKESMHPGSNAD